MEPLSDIDIALLSIGEGYERIAEIGRGSVGVVYSCRRAGSEEAPGVAVKLMSPSPIMDIGVFDGIIDAALATRPLADKAAVVPVIEAGKNRDGKFYYITMKLMDGTMASLIGDERSSFQEKCDFAAKIAAALDVVHSNGVVHGDLKPPNVLLEGGAPFLNDFYLAPWRLGVAAPSTRGTPYYMSPEQASGRPVTPASDLYSLGVLLYQLFTGEMPYRKNPENLSEMIDAVREDTPPPPSSRNTGVDCDLDEVVMRLLEKNPADRPSRPSLVANTLTEIANGYGKGKRRWSGTWFGNLFR